MQLDNKFKLVMEYLETPNPNHHAGDKQISYLTFDPSQTIEVKSRVASWLSLAKGYDYSGSALSMASVINEFFRNNSRRNSWSVPDGNSTFDEVVDFYKVDLGSFNGSSISVQPYVLEKHQPTKFTSYNPLPRNGSRNVPPF